ncbi:MAG: hypothetical protein J7521_07590 [Caulobacter sp.]|nr:hypothetical protein [Caulobacter sp.]
MSDEGDQLRHGLALEPWSRACDRAREFIDSPREKLALSLFETLAPDAYLASRDRLRGSWAHALSEGGRGAIVAVPQEQMGDLREHLRTFFSDPIVWRNLPSWVLLYALRQASSRVQVDHLPAPNHENHITGKLLEAIGMACETWSLIVDEGLAANNDRVVIEQIDLSILGGEQATGGDFGLIIDQSALSEPQTDEWQKPMKPIVPFIFQAKRFTGKHADVSQRHKIRGFQRDLLGRNPCASAYIFYENGDHRLNTTLPPLVKSIAKVQSARTTDPRQDSSDLASFILPELWDPYGAPWAEDSQDALEMVYAQAAAGQLSSLAVVTSEAGRAAIYERQLAQLAGRDKQIVEAT